MIDDGNGREVSSWLAVGRELRGSLVPILRATRSNTLQITRYMHTIYIVGICLWSGCLACATIWNTAALPVPGIWHSSSVGEHKHVRLRVRTPDAVLL